MLPTGFLQKRIWYSVWFNFICFVVGLQQQEYIKKQLW